MTAGDWIAIVGLVVTSTFTIGTLIMSYFKSCFRLMLAEELAKQLVLINGTYVRTEIQRVTNSKVSESIEAHGSRLNTHSDRIRKCELDITNLTSSYSRNFRPQPDQ